MKKIQDKIKESLNKQSLSIKSFERLSNALKTSKEDDMETDDRSNDNLDALETVIASTIIDSKGENKAPTKTSKRKKHKQQLLSRKEKGVIKAKDSMKHQPRYFVKF